MQTAMLCSCWPCIGSIASMGSSCRQVARFLSQKRHWALIRARGDFEVVSDNDDDYIDFSTQVSQPQLTRAGEPAEKPPATQAWITSQIGDFCAQTTNGHWIVNSTLGQYGPKGYAASDTAPNFNNDLWLSISHDPGCDANTSYEVELNSCQNSFSMALNGCNTNGLTMKWGGQVQANCALWNITTRAGHNSRPPNGYPPATQQFSDG